MLGHGSHTMHMNPPHLCMTVRSPRAGMSPGLDNQDLKAPGQRYKLNRLTN